MCGRDVRQHGDDLNNPPKAIPGRESVSPNIVHPLPGVNPAVPDFVRAEPARPGDRAGFARLPHVVAADPRLIRGDAAIVSALLSFACSRDWCSPSNARIGAYARASEATVARSLARLERVGYIRRQRVRPTFENATGRIILLLLGDAPAAGEGRSQASAPAPRRRAPGALNLAAPGSSSAIDKQDVVVKKPEDSPEESRIEASTTTTGRGGPSPVEAMIASIGRSSRKPIVAPKPQGRPAIARQPAEARRVAPTAGAVSTPDDDARKLAVLVADVDPAKIARFREQNPAHRSFVIRTAELAGQGDPVATRELEKWRAAKPGPAPCPMAGDPLVNILAALDRGDPMAVGPLSSHLAAVWDDAKSRPFYDRVGLDIATGRRAIEDLEDALRQANGPKAISPVKVFVHAWSRPRR